MGTILPSGEEVQVTPEEVLRYLNPDGLRQLLRQERLRWNLKPNRDSDFYSNTTLFRYSGDLHNDGDHQRMDVRAFPDNGANPGYAGIYIDGGEFGMVHGHERWDDAMSRGSAGSIAPRLEIGARATHLDEGPVQPPREGHGLNPETNTVEEYSRHREATHVYDSVDGRIYNLTNDEAFYVNNKERDPEKKLPGRTDARIIDIPVDLSDLDNESELVADWDYHHTDNSLGDSLRFVAENLDDRTFVSPELAKDSSGAYLRNRHVGLAGGEQYGEGDGISGQNTQPDLTGTDREGAAPSSIDAGKSQLKDNGYNRTGYFPGIFRSYEELLKVDLLRQRRTELTHDGTPSGRRRQNFYQFDGIWSYDAFGDYPKRLRNLDPVMNPANMEGITLDPAKPELDREAQPYPYHAIQPQLSSGQNGNYATSELYQWRYNRVNVLWHSRNLVISVLDGGAHYKVGDVLRYNFLNKWIYYRVTHVGNDDTITGGHYIQPDDPNHPHPEHGYVSFDHNPSTNGVGVVFKDMTSSGRGCRLIISCPVSFEPQATQLKNNLWALVDVVPSIASTVDSPWSDSHPVEDDHVVDRSTAPAPAYSGVNSGRGGAQPAANSSETPLYEHGGNATAGAHVHLFRYVIDTTGESYEIIDGVKVYTGAWVDQGPLGVERPADIKALYLSNQDTNNFNNYYKFMLDILIDQLNRDGDRVVSANVNTWSSMYIHVAETDPWEQPIGEIHLRGPSQQLYENYLKVDGYKVKLLRTPPANGILDHQAFFDKRVDPITSEVTMVEITNRVLYVNAGTRVAFIYNPESKTDVTFGYGHEPRGWLPLAGTITK